MDTINNMKTSLETLSKENEFYASEIKNLKLTIVDMEENERDVLYQEAEKKSQLVMGTQKTHDHGSVKEQYIGHTGTKKIKF